uniref:G_PROTEIN_RECEP_F1_2 domain-containing protein n=1 Tax=Meloidogyne hapla TaxID=6305 RepID=A0A1I8BLM6_MELHA
MVVTQIKQTTNIPPTTTPLFSSSINSTEEDKNILPPEHLFSDYIEIAYLGFVILTGLTLNFCVLKRLLIEKKMTERGGRPKNGFVLLKLNLNISDLLILLIHALGKLGWLITYEWKGGECLCRIFNFLSMFTLYLSSNIVICIALDRLTTVLNAQKLNMGQQKIWSIERYERYLEKQQFTNKNILFKNSTNWREFVLSPLIQNGYELTHLFLVFYGPLIVLIICYALISTRLIRFAANNPRNIAKTSQSINQQNCSVPNNEINNRKNVWKRRCSKRASVRSFPAVRLYCQINGDCCHQPVLSPTIEKSSFVNENDCEIDINNTKSTEDSPQNSSSPIPPPNPTSISSNNKTNNYSKQTTIDLNENYNKNNFIRRSSHLCNCRSSISTNSSSNFTHLISKQQNQAEHEQENFSSAKRIFVRLRNSFTLRFSNGHRLLTPNNIPVNCSGESWEDARIGEEESDEVEKAENEKRNKSPNICEEFTGYRPLSASLGHYNPRYRQKRFGSNGVGGILSALKKQQDSPPKLRSSSIRSSSLSTIGGGGGGCKGTPSSLPLWRRHLKSRAFRATLLVILAHVLLWSPYNVYALMKHCNEKIYEQLSEQINVLKDLQFLIVLINPFLYGFGRRVQGKEGGGKDTNNHT